MMPVPRAKEGEHETIKERTLSLWKFEPLKDKVLHGAALLHVARALPRRTEHIDIVGGEVDHPLVKAHEMEVLLEPVKYVLNRNGICVVTGKDVAEVVVDKIEAALREENGIKHSFDIGYLYGYDTYRIAEAIPVMRSLLKMKFGVPTYRKKLLDFMDLIPPESMYMAEFPEAMPVLLSDAKRYRKSISMSAVELVERLMEG